MNAKEARAIDRFIAAADKRIMSGGDGATIKLYDALKVDLIEMLSNRRVENKAAARRAAGKDQAMIETRDLAQAAEPCVGCGGEGKIYESFSNEADQEDIQSSRPCDLCGGSGKSARRLDAAPLICGLNFGCPKPEVCRKIGDGLGCAVPPNTHAGAAVDSWLFDNGGRGA